MIGIDFESIINRINSIPNTTFEGKVSKVIGLTVEVEGIKAFVGELCIIHNNMGMEIQCEVVGFKEDCVILMPLGELIGVSPGCKVVGKGVPLNVRCSDELLGKILDGLGNPIDGELQNEDQIITGH